jgi:zinc/manganese transport system substrate-binding protein
MSKPASVPTSQTGPTDVSDGLSIAANGKLKVVAAENFYGEVVQAVGGDRVAVQSVINNPVIDPHNYEPTPDAAKVVSEAQMIIYNGIGYDDWMGKLINTSSTPKTVIRVAEDVAGKKAGDNEHVWYDPETMGKLAEVLANQLAKLDPEQASAFRQRAENYKVTLKPLADLEKKLKQATPASVDVTEPVFDYMLQALNFQIQNPRFAKAIEEETDPAPADVARVQDDLKGRKIKFLVKNSQTDSPITADLVNLAKANDIPVVEVTETEPVGKNYVQWMTEQLNQVASALDMHNVK